MIEYKDILNKVVFLFAKKIINSSELKLEQNAITDQNQDDVILFLYFALATLTNQEYVDDINTLEVFNAIKFNQNDNNYEIGKHNKKILQNIRNAFAHSSSKILIDLETDNFSITNESFKNVFSITISKKDLISLFKESIKKQGYENDSVNKIFDLIKKVEENDFENLDKETYTLVSLCLMFCYNKESLFDKFLEEQQSFLDCSKFSVETVPEWNRKEISTGFLDKYNVIFKSDASRKKFNSSWYNYYDKKEEKEKSFIFNLENSPVDKTTNRVIPVPLVMKHLRNSLSHGYFEVTADKYVFYDKPKKNKPVVITLEISKENLHEFLSQDLFYESLFTDYETLSNDRNYNMYFFERAQSANDFENYVLIYRLRFPNLTERQIIEYMIENHKIAVFLLEHPDQINSAFSYRLKDNTTVYNCIREKDFISGMTTEENVKLNKKKLCSIAKMFADSIFGLNLKFWEAYFCFNYNKNRVDGLLDYNNLDEEQAKFVKVSGEKLYAKHKYLGTFLKIGRNPVILQEVMMTVYPECSVSRFYDIILATHFNESFAKKEKFRRPKKFVVQNVETFSAENQMIFSTIHEKEEKMKTLKRISQISLIGIALVTAYIQISGADVIVSAETKDDAIKGLIEYGSYVLIRNTVLFSAINYIYKYKENEFLMLIKKLGFYRKATTPQFEENHLKLK